MEVRESAVSAWTVMIELNGTEQPYPRVIVNVLPDNVLLDIFDFYLAEVRGRIGARKSNFEDAWHTLVHVCRRWRYIVFASPCRLRLELLCTNRRPVTKYLHIWPILPIVIHSHVVPPSRHYWGVTHVIAALKRHNRVRMIHLDAVPHSLLEKIAELKNPFPVLTDLRLSPYERYSPPVFTDSFLGGSAPRLQNLDLCNIPFPRLGRLLLSTSHLTKLSLRDIPYSEYMLPGAMVTSLSTLTRLKELVITLTQNWYWFPRPQDSPSPKTVVLPALTNFKFTGKSWYLEGFLSLIDAPSLEVISLEFFNQPSSASTGTPQLRQFLSRTEAFKTSHRVHIRFDKSRVKVTLSWKTRESGHPPQKFQIIFKCPSWAKLSSLVQLCSLCLSPLLTVERLSISQRGPFPVEDGTASLWLELLAHFISVTDLKLSWETLFAVAPSLGELTGANRTKVLPALQNIFARQLPPGGHVEKAIVQFVAARRLSGRPLTVHQHQGPGGKIT
jgi:hypothetical protein